MIINVTDDNNAFMNPYIIEEYRTNTHVWIGLNIWNLTEWQTTSYWTDGTPFNFGNQTAQFPPWSIHDNGYEPKDPNRDDDVFLGSDFDNYPAWIIHDGNNGWKAADFEDGRNDVRFVCNSCSRKLQKYIFIRETFDNWLIANTGCKDYLGTTLASIQWGPDYGQVHM